MNWILMSERSDEYELSIDALPPMLDRLDLHFDDGRAIETTPPQIEVPYSKHPDEYFTDNIVVPTRLGLLINETVKDVFDDLGVDNIQYFPAKLRERSTEEVREDYWIANVVGKHECVDQERSELELFGDGAIMFIDGLVLEPDAATEYGHIFRLAEFPPVLVISDDLKRSLERADVTGFRIYRPEEFSL